MLGSSVCLQGKVNAKALKVGSSSTMVINGADVHIDDLSLEGSLVVDTVPGASLQIKGLHEKNDGWRWMGLNPNKPMTEVQAIRCAALQQNSCQCDLMLCMHVVIAAVQC